MTNVNKEKMRAVGVTTYMDGDKLMYDIDYKSCKDIALDMIKELMGRLHIDKNIPVVVDDYTIRRYKTLIYSSPKSAYDCLMIYETYVDNSNDELRKLYNDTLEAIKDCF